MEPITIRLSGYAAILDTKGPLILGTYASYGVEQVQVIPETGWDGLTITATFVTPDSSTRVLVSEGGVIDVPQEATSKALSLGKSGKIVFSGVADGVQRITTNVDYLVADHAPVEGADPAPTPSEWEQFVSQVKGDADRAESAAGRAEDAAEKAKQAAENAFTSEKSAAQSAANALQSKNAAAQSAKDAAAELEKVQNASADALSKIGTAKDDAISAVTGAGTTQTGKVENAGTEALKAIDTAKTSAVSAVGSAGTKAEQDIGTAKETALTAISDAQVQATQAIQQAGQTATKQVQDEGTTQAKAVTEAGNAKLQQIEEANALLPTPTEADAGKAPIAQPDGTYALEQVIVDAYTKAEADARYAPIEAAIKVSGKGTGLVALSPTVRWFPQGLKLYGRSWQDGTPSVEQEVPIQNAGQSGQIDVTVCGVNLLDIPALNLGGKTVNGVTCQLNEDQTINLSGRATNDYLLTVNTSIPLVNGQQYKCFYASESLKNDYIVRGYNTKADADSGQNHVDQKYLNDLQIFTVPNDRRYYKVFKIRLSARSGGLKGQVVNVNNACLGFYVYKGLDEIYKPYTDQQLPIHTPDGLPGVPVDIGGNWVDETGQAWVSDMVDFVAQERTKAIYHLNAIQDSVLLFFKSSANVAYVTATISGAAVSTVQKMAICNRFSPIRWNDGDTGTIGIATVNGQVRIYLGTASGVESIDDFMAWLQSHPLDIYFVLATPITTPLDAETVAAYKALQTYPGTTNILAPDAGIEASALAEPNQYIEDKIQAAIIQAVAQTVELTGGNT